LEKKRSEKRVVQPECTDRLSTFVRASVDCEDYEASANGRTCKHFIANGGCELTKHFMCVVWEKKQREKQAKAGVPPQSPPATQADAMRMAPAKRACGCAELPVGFSTSDILEFRNRGIEVHLSSPTLGDIWLVPSLTGADRNELTYESLATLVGAKLVFPDAQVTRLAFSKEK
jgi:hypothetical protein